MAPPAPSRSNWCRSRAGEPTRGSRCRGGRATRCRCSSTSATRLVAGCAELMTGHPDRAARIPPTTAPIVVGRSPASDKVRAEVVEQPARALFPPVDGVEAVEVHGLLGVGEAGGLSVGLHDDGRQ